MLTISDLNKIRSIVKEEVQHHIKGTESRLESSLETEIKESDNRMKQYIKNALTDNNLILIGQLREYVDPILDGHEKRITKLEKEKDLLIHDGE